jgi:predicted metal-binding membrane protein
MKRREFIGGLVGAAALIATFIPAEKTLPRGELLRYAGGAALIGWGGWMLSVHALS